MFHLASHLMGWRDPPIRMFEYRTLSFVSVALLTDSVLPVCRGHNITVLRSIVFCVNVLFGELAEIAKKTTIISSCVSVRLLARME